MSGNGLGLLRPGASFKSLVTELCDLEKNGLLVDGKVFTVRLVCVLGDNLGSHWLGGFSTNFSRNNYVCRYCLVRQTDDKHSLMQNADMRTRENYNSAVLALSDTTTTVQGIVRQSVLNCLTHFHVCLPGLPPCLSHDHFEGIVKFDVGLILKSSQVK